jgi:methionine-rich copper-binding protein CopC
MADRTYQELNINEIRAVELTIENKDGVSFSPSAAWVTVNDSQGNDIVARQSASTSGNQISTVIGTITTSATGDYSIIWEMLSGDGYIYYHCTQLEVIPLCLGD